MEQARNGEMVRISQSLNGSERFNVCGKKGSANFEIVSRGQGKGIFWSLCRRMELIESSLSTSWCRNSTSVPEQQEEVSGRSRVYHPQDRRKNILRIGTIDNAGHTIVANGITYDFHLLPSGLINPNCTNLIGSGVVVHVPAFFKELDDLKIKGLTVGNNRLFISDRAHVVFDLHQLVDGIEEVALNKGAIGTTRKGIGVRKPEVCHQRKC